MIIRRLCLILAVSLVGQFAHAQTTLPIERILLDLDDSPLSRVKTIAAEQAKVQWKMDKGPLYKSAPQTQNNNPNQISDEVIFVGVIVPRSSATKLAVFSDDGCDVWIDGKLVLNNSKKGQHLPDLKQSLHVLDKFKPVPGRSYEIRIHYTNTIFTGQTDIDGCTLFAYAGGAESVVPVIETEIPLGKAGDPTNKTALGTIVVADKDSVYADKEEPALRRKVTFAPSAGKAKLTIKRAAEDPKDAAQAANVKLFENKQPQAGEKDLFGGKNEFETEEIDAAKPKEYWLQGGTDPSKKVRFQKITAEIANVKMVDELRVTVLWVDLGGFNQGDVSTDKNGIYDGYLAAYQHIVEDVEKVGPDNPPLRRGLQRCGPKSRYTDVRVGGVAEFQGDIKPTDLLAYRADAFSAETVMFQDPVMGLAGKPNLPAAADFGFIFRRNKHTERYANGLTPDKELTEKKYGFSSKGSDDSLRNFQDIHPDDPDAGGPTAGKRLLIVDVDSPGILVNTKISFQSYRANFSEHVIFNYFKRVPERCSAKLKWATSQDIAFGGLNSKAENPKDKIADFEKAVFVFGLPNDNTAMTPNTVNEVLVQGKGGVNTGELESLKLELEKPEITGVEGPKELKVKQSNYLAIDGKNLIGQVILREKKKPGNPLILPTSVLSVPNNDATHSSPSTRLFAIFRPLEAMKDVEFELLIVNVAGESKAIEGFTIP